MDLRVDELKKRHPWPDRQPRVPEDWHGWLSNDTLSLPYWNLSGSTRLVVECGSWLGLSARAILLGAPNAVLVCCDHWKGSPEHQLNFDCVRRLPALYETFLRKTCGPGVNGSSLSARTVFMPWQKSFASNWSPT